MAGYRDELERLNFSAEEKEALTCLEDSKLTGAWLTPHELIVLNCEGKLESWSRIVYDAMLREGARYGL